MPHLALPANVGFAAAVNLGVARTRRRASSASTPTPCSSPAAWRALLAALDADPALGGVQPRILQLEEDAGARTPPPPASTAPARR